MSSLGMLIRNTFINKNAPLNNGVGRFIPQLARITLKFCKSHGSSTGVRSFIEQDIVQFAKDNPGVVIYLKPRRHRSPVLVAEFLNGERHWQSLNNYTNNEVSAYFDVYRSHSGREYSDQFKNTYTDHPSIQGYWNGTTNKEPGDSFLQYPQPKVPLALEPSATEILQNMFQSQESRGNLPAAEEERLRVEKQGTTR
ncbi:39S ribosomal protein L43, mitochondrial [Eurytemora carolleeae]|uniref:39S ribosomal protein L43, mitochondrial n=1 Tax=Eurytemora carolleeae TaxID=1294199 RepID=UPI000C792B54|nr:39S ribosomal protein L43, mitochondrial [Eurytemora carolleeae]|eukprot:XP_023345755.1 39S ribosomal protein L43, mitochondrial-like [Eurytemora affinis]